MAWICFPCVLLPYVHSHSILREIDESYQVSCQPSPLHNCESWMDTSAASQVCHSRSADLLAYFCVTPRSRIQIDCGKHTEYEKVVGVCLG
jgi:hypothetical protein